MQTVLVNAGPLIALGKLNRLQLLLDLYGTVHVPRAVYREVVEGGMAHGAPDARTVRLFLERYSCPIFDVPEAVVQSFSPEIALDAGERELLAWALTLEEPLVLLDDEAARGEARRLGLSVRGTLGVLVASLRAGTLSRLETERLILEIGSRPDIWISETLCRSIVEQLE